MNQNSNLGGVLDISPKENKAPWPCRADELAFSSAQFRSGYAGDECPRGHTRPISPVPTLRSRKPPLFFLDDALSAGGFQTVAKLDGLIRRAERANHRPIIDALLTKISPFDDRRALPQHVGKLGLQGPIGGLGVSLTTLRRHLNEVSVRRRNPGIGCIGR